MRVLKFFFLDTEIVLDIFGSQRGLINCLMVLDILEGQKRQGWVFQPSATQKAVPKAAESTAHKTSKAAQRSRSSKNNITTNNKEHQTAANTGNKHQKDQQKQHKQQQNSTNNSPRDTRAQKVGNEGLLVLSGVFSWNFGGVLEFFLEISNVFNNWLLNCEVNGELINC